MGKGLGVVQDLKKKRVRKRKRKKPEAVNHIEQEDQTFPKTCIPFFSIKEELPPDINKDIIIWESGWGFGVYKSFIVRQKIEDSINLQRKPLVQYWAYLQK